MENNKDMDVTEDVELFINTNEMLKESPIDSCKVKLSLWFYLQNKFFGYSCRKLSAILKNVGADMSRTTTAEWVKEGKHIYEDLKVMMFLLMKADKDTPLMSSVRCQPLKVS